MDCKSDLLTEDASWVLGHTEIAGRVVGVCDWNDEGPAVRDQVLVIHVGEVDDGVVLAPADHWERISNNITR